MGVSHPAGGKEVGFTPRFLDAQAKQQRAANQRLWTAHFSKAEVLQAMDEHNLRSKYDAAVKAARHSSLKGDRQDSTTEAIYRRAERCALDTRVRTRQALVQEAMRSRGNLATWQRLSRQTEECQQRTKRRKVVTGGSRQRAQSRAKFDEDRARAKRIWRTTEAWTREAMGASRMPAPKRRQPDGTKHAKQSRLSRDTYSGQGWKQETHTVKSRRVPSKQAITQRSESKMNRRSRQKRLRSDLGAGTARDSSPPSTQPIKRNMKLRMQYDATPGRVHPEKLHFWPVVLLSDDTATACCLRHNRPQGCPDAQVHTGTRLREMRRS